MRVVLINFEGDEAGGLVIAAALVLLVVVLPVVVGLVWRLRDRRKERDRG